MALTMDKLLEMLTAADIPTDTPGVSVQAALDAMPDPADLTAADISTSASGVTVQDAINGIPRIVFSATAPSSPVEGMIWLKPAT